MTKTIQVTFLLSFRILRSICCRVPQLYAFDADATEILVLIHFKTLFLNSGTRILVRVHRLMRIFLSSFIIKHNDILRVNKQTDTPDVFICFSPSSFFLPLYEGRTMDDLTLNGKSVRCFISSYCCAIVNPLARDDVISFYKQGWMNNVHFIRTDKGGK